MEFKTGLTTKDKVLLFLKENKDFVSGEDISGKLSLSRAAVNACVKTLRSEGYEIDSVTRRGYKLLYSPDALNAGEIAHYLHNRERMETVACFNEVGSTNTVLLDPSAEVLPTGSVAVADRQTGGRGRMGRPFYSPAGHSVYLSYLICPLSDSGSACTNLFPLPSAIQTGTVADLYSPAAWTALTSCTAVAMADAIETVSDLRPRIKWVNDLYIDDKKVTGILTQMDIEPESAHVRRIVIGTGINANGKNDEFPPELQNIAGTVENACGHKLSRAHLAAEMIRELDLMISGWPVNKSAYLERYRQDCFITDKDVTVIMPGTPGRAAHTLEITDDFALRVRYEDGTIEDLNGGEISIRL